MAYLPRESPDARHGDLDPQPEARERAGRTTAIGLEPRGYPPGAGPHRGTGQEPAPGRRAAGADGIAPAGSGMR
ncbi:hypothetical protein PSD17_56840 [Pseudonocardia sp. D17]|nr:hypothetical protein PSD17_56840 [Pseudonocardia sp. D17]